MPLPSPCGSFEERVDYPQTVNYALYYTLEPGILGSTQVLERFLFAAPCMRGALG